MDCPDCGSRAIVFSVPDDLQAYAPERSEAAAVCSRCFAVVPADSTAVDRSSRETGQGGPAVADVHDALPADETDAIRVVLLLGLLESLALNRSEIGALLEELERRGVDVLLAVDRLAADPDLDPRVDLDRRRTQLEQLLY